MVEVGATSASSHPKLSTGCNVEEIFVFPLIGILSFFINKLVHDRFLQKTDQGKKLSFRWICFIEIAINVGPQALLVTAYANAWEYIILLQVTFICIFSFFFWPSYKQMRKREYVDFPKADRSFLDGYRVFLHVSTFICILAVDFPTFPLRFAKTLTYGISPMDCGTGMIIYGMGINQGLYQPDRRTEYKKWFESTGILLVLGVMRPIVLTFLNYDHDVTEYGVHWNFFLTLFCIRFGSELPHFIPFAAASAVMYYVTLPANANYYLREERDLNSWYDSNREGLWSLGGYFFLFYFGSMVTTLWRQKNNVYPTGFSMFFTFVIFAVTAAFYYVFRPYLPLPSRRLANFTYVIILIAYSNITLTLYQFVSWQSNQWRLIPGRQPMVELLSRRGLHVFLIANVLTGFCKLFVTSRAFGQPLAQFVVLALYSLGVCGLCMKYVRLT